MNERSISSTFDSKYHRARCPVCGVVCPQRRRLVMLPDGTKHWAYDCIECEMVYVPKPVLAAAEPTAAESRQLAEQMYGCINCRNSDPRYCAESGHRDCDAGRVATELARGEP
jgi:hypothetical protein